MFVFGHVVYLANECVYGGILRLEDDRKVADARARLLGASAIFYACCALADVDEFIVAVVDVNGAATVECEQRWSTDFRCPCCW